MTLIAGTIENLASSDFPDFILKTTLMRSYYHVTQGFVCAEIPDVETENSGVLIAFSAQGALFFQGKADES